ncbi:unnamed protein product [Didymodactylos carnosus]|uniref:Uncharacterized protein n=1 Tax=Didymodactylos carnosus TaxID=1234261 RepID=A0A813V1R1_9BILA|nr:unnamed protein product [Didymodactylos carnosus]CAF3624308.1 unnamed protein product [Didymodactylos carnosus]
MFRKKIKQEVNDNNDDFNEHTQSRNRFSIKQQRLSSNHLSIHSSKSILRGVNERHQSETQCQCACAKKVENLEKKLNTILEILIRNQINLNNDLETCQTIIADEDEKEQEEEFIEEENDGEINLSTVEEFPNAVLTETGFNLLLLKAASPSSFLSQAARKIFTYEELRIGCLPDYRGTNQFVPLNENKLRLMLYAARVRYGMSDENFKYTWKTQLRRKFAQFLTDNRDRFSNAQLLDDGGNICDDPSSSYIDCTY